MLLSGERQNPNRVVYMRKSFMKTFILMLALFLLALTACSANETQKNQTPHLSYSIKIIVNGIEKNIYWEDSSLTKSKKAIKLKGVFNRMVEIITAKKEYKDFPPPEVLYD